LGESEAEITGARLRASVTAFRARSRVAMGCCGDLTRKNKKKGRVRREMKKLEKPGQDVVLQIY